MDGPLGDMDAGGDREDPAWCWRGPTGWMGRHTVAGAAEFSRAMRRVGGLLLARAAKTLCWNRAQGDGMLAGRTGKAFTSPRVTGPIASCRCCGLSTW